MTIDQKRVAIVHFSAAPAVGGIEQSIDAQAAVIRSLGHYVVKVAGHAGPGVECVPRLHPGHPDVELALRELDGIAPNPSHALVQQLAIELAAILSDVTDCWVHNAVTVTLNPFVTLALCKLINDIPELRWTVWAEDITASSRFADCAAFDSLSPARTVKDRVRWVTISQTRRVQLAGLLGIPAAMIDVTTPPLNLPGWLVPGPQTVRILSELNLIEAHPVVFVPAKALPHKGLQRAIEVAAALVRRFRHPLVLITAAPSPHQPQTSWGVVRELQSRVLDLRLDSVVYLLSDLLGSTPNRGTVRDLMLLSDAVLLPSAEEGFGLPLLEAASLRTPVVCTDIPVFREVAGDAASYFAATASAERIADLIADAAGGAANRFRREATLSGQRYALAIRKLLDAG